MKSSTCDTAGVTHLIESHVTGARLNSNVSAELSYVLPQESKAHFSRLLTVLDSQKEALGIVSCGVSVTTMDEVFIRYALLLVLFTANFTQSSSSSFLACNSKVKVKVSVFI